MVDLLGNLLLIQEKLLEQNPDTTNVLYPGTSSTNCASHGSNDSDGDDEEISSDSEEEKRSNDGDLDREELANGREEEESLKLPNKRKKHTMVTLFDILIKSLVSIDCSVKDLCSFDANQAITSVSLKKNHSLNQNKAINLLIPVQCCNPDWNSPSQVTSKNVPNNLLIAHSYKEWQACYDSN